MSETNQKIYFHIGPPKTGTTAIQRHMKRFEAKNAESGVWYPDSQLPRHSQLEKHLFLPFSAHVNEPWGVQFYSERMISDNLAAYSRIRQGYLSDIVNAVRAGMNIVISSEGFFNDYPGFARNVGELSARNAAKFASELGLSPQIIIYLRHPIDTWLSQLHQNAALTVIGTDEDIVDVIEHRLQSLREKIQMLSGIFGAQNLIIRNFASECFTGGTIVNDFRSAVGLPQIEDDDPRPNSRDGGKTVRLRLEMNRHIIAGLTDSEDPQVCFSPFSKTYPKAFPGDTSSYLPPRHLLEEAIRKIEPYRDYFFQLSGNDRLFGPGYADKYLELVRDHAQPDLSQNDFLSALDTVQKQADYEIIEAMLNHADIRKSAPWFISNIRRAHDLSQLQELHAKAVAEGAKRVASIAARHLSQLRSRPD